jgi:gluconolactonase
MLTAGSRAPLLVAALASTLLSAPASAEDYPTFGSVERLDPRLDALVRGSAPIEVVASGFAWSEGPVWVAEDGGALLFSDVPRNQILRFKEKGGISVYMHPSGYTGVSEYSREPGSNGLALDREGRLAACEHGDRRVSLLYPDGGKRTLADNYQGKRFNSPNDLALHSSGAFYFTDPPYGLPGGAEDTRRELDWSGVYRVSPDGKVTLVTAELSRPNGIGLSPDEKTLYVANSDPKRAVWMAYDLRPDGSVGAGRVFFDATSLVAGNPGLPDGLKLDVNGNLFATGPGGVFVFAPDGSHLGTIRTGRPTANCAWGGDGSDLYLTAGAYLARIRLTTRGARWPPPR